MYACKASFCVYIKYITGLCWVTYLLQRIERKIGSIVNGTKPFIRCSLASSLFKHKNRLSRFFLTAAVRRAAHNPEELSGWSPPMNPWKPWSTPSRRPSSLSSFSNAKYHTKQVGVLFFPRFYSAGFCRSSVTHFFTLFLPSFAPMSASSCGCFRLRKLVKLIVNTFGNYAFRLRAFMFQLFRPVSPLGIPLDGRLKV